MKKKIITLLFFTLSTSLMATNLKTVINELLSTNPLVLERLHNYQVTRKDIVQAQSAYYPQLNLQFAYGIENTDKKRVTTQSTQFSIYENSLKYTQNIFNGFDTSSNVKREEYRTIASAYSYIEKVNKTAFEMTNSYLQVMQNRELLIIEQENVTINEDIAQKVHKLYDAGLTTLSEVNKIESSLALAHSNLVVQENTILDEAYTFKRVLGRHINPATMLKPTIKVSLPKTRKEALVFAIKNNPSLLVSKFNIQVRQATKTKEQARFYPKIDIELSQTMSKNLSAIEGENSRFRAMAYLSYNIFNGFSDTTKVQQSISNIHKEIETKNSLERSVIEGLNISWAAKTKLKEQLKYLKEYRDFSFATLELYSKEYDLGRRSLLDLLSAQNDFIKAKAQIITAEYSLLYAKYRILDAMGILVSSTLQESADIAYSNVNLTNSIKR